MSRPQPRGWEPCLVRTDAATAGGRSDRSRAETEGRNVPSLFLDQKLGKPGWVERPSAHRGDAMTRRSHRGTEVRAHHQSHDTKFRLAAAVQVLSGALRSGFLQQLLLFGGAALLLLLVGASAAALNSPAALKVYAVATRVAASIPREVRARQLQSPSLDTLSPALGPGSRPPSSHNP